MNTNKEELAYKYDLFYWFKRGNRWEKRPEFSKESPLPTPIPNEVVEAVNQAETVFIGKREEVNSVVSKIIRTERADRRKRLEPMRVIEANLPLPFKELP